jgi:hypothetical protein
MLGESGVGLPEAYSADEIQRSAGKEMATASTDFEQYLRQAIHRREETLPASTLSFMESRFGRDFSAVRVHDNAQADALAQGVNARAFTLGQDLFFARSQYQPETMQGRHLIAHELAHVVQQGKVEPTIMRTIDCSRFSGSRPPSTDEARFLTEDFPRLRPEDFCVTAERTSSYNCYAFSVGITNQFIDESIIDTQYGNRDGTLTFADLNEFYNAYGLVPTDVDGEVVVFGNGRMPQHAAKRTPFLSGGRPVYESKLGQEERIAHFIDELEGGLYGNIQRGYARVPLRIRQLSHTTMPYEIERGQP